ncbi:hypothetical protein ACQJBY_050340 [Aegilops geniculata]
MFIPRLRSLLFLMHTVCIPCASPLGLSFEIVLMELVELSTVSLAEAMFEKLELPKPVYHVHQLEQGGYKAQVEFHRTKERFHASARRVKLPSPVCVDGEASMNHMESREALMCIILIVALTLSIPFFPPCTKPSLAHPVSSRPSSLFLNFDCNINTSIPQVDPH